MIVIMESGATQEQVDHVCDRIKEFGYGVHPIYGEERVVIGAIGDERGDKARLQVLESAPGVEKVVPILKPFKLVGKELKKEKTTVKVGNAEIGSDQFVVIGGPCSIETEEQTLSTARCVKDAGAQLFRGGAFKPRTSPYSFQGLEEEGLQILKKAREETGLCFVTEVLNPMDIELVARYSDMLQVGARNMQNFSLLKLLGQLDKPILLKRGMMSTIKELLMSAEYIVSEGNPNVVLCERGIRTFEEYTRNTLDLSAVPLLKELTHLPVVVDPAHATGIRSLIIPMTKAAIAAGADGIIVEVHPQPEMAWSDGAQSLMFDQFSALMDEVKRYLPLENRHL